MKSLKAQDIIPLAGDPFESCKLDRKQYAEILTSIIETYNDGFVLGLNNKWGEGKTTFIRMWRLYLGQPERGFKTLYLNAWEHDFNHDPLSAILSELKSLDIYEKLEFAPLLKKGAKLTKSLIPVIIGALAEKYISINTIKNAFERLSEEAATIFEEEVNEYASKKRGLEEFKIELAKYIGKLKNKPLVFFIDELDRCNPKYAVEFLEVIKHFFSVPGIVFVISIDKEQLSHSIKGYFGSESINTEEYLRRFIDLEYSIPAPKLDDYIHYMLQKSGANEFINHDSRRYNSAFQQENDQFYNLAYSYFNNSEVSLRLIEKILNHTSLILKTFHLQAHTWPQVLFTFIFIKFLNPKLYKKIRNKDFSPQELLDELFEFLSPLIKVNKNIDLLFLEAFILTLYCKKKDDWMAAQIWEGSGDSRKLLVKSRFHNFKQVYPKSFEDSLTLVESWDLRNSELNDILSRVEILNNLKTN